MTAPGFAVPRCRGDEDSVRRSTVGANTHRSEQNLRGRGSKPKPISEPERLGRGGLADRVLVTRTFTRNTSNTRRGAAQFGCLKSKYEPQRDCLFPHPSLGGGLLFLRCFLVTGPEEANEQPSDAREARPLATVKLCREAPPKPGPSEPNMAAPELEADPDSLTRGRQRAAAAAAKSRALRGDVTSHRETQTFFGL